MGVSLEEYLAMVGANAQNWRILHGLFAAGTLLALIGLAGLTGRLQATPGGMWAVIGLTLFASSTLLWFLQLGFRVAVTP